MVVRSKEEEKIKKLNSFSDPLSSELGASFLPEALAERRGKICWQFRVIDLGQGVRGFRFRIYGVPET